MESLDYRKMLTEAKAELERLHGQRANAEDHLANIDSKIEAMTHTVNALAPLLGEELVPTLASPSERLRIDALKTGGIALAVRSLLDQTAGELTTPEIRDNLHSFGWDWKNYVNPLSAIHNTLKRLMASNLVIEVTTKTGKCYRSAKHPPDIQAVEGKINKVFDRNKRK